MPKAIQEEKANEMKSAHWWSSESQSLYVTNGVRKVRFNDFCVTLDLSDPLHKEVNAMLEDHRSRGVEYHLVLTQKNDRTQQRVMMSKIRQMLSPDSDGHADDVAKVSGVLQLSALFTDEELSELGCARRNPDVDLLTLEASANKFIQGVE